MRKIFILLSYCLLPFAAWGQRDSIVLDTVEVRGVSFHRGISSSTPVQEVSKKKMIDWGVFNIEDALKHISGIMVKDYGGAGGLKMVSVRGLGAKHTAVEYDGITLTDNQTGEIDLSKYSLANMKMLKLVIGDGDQIFKSAKSMSSQALLELQSEMMNDSIPEKHVLHAGLSVGSWHTIEPSLYSIFPLNNKMKIGFQGDYLYSKNDFPFILENVSLRTKKRRVNSQISRGRIEGDVALAINSQNSLNMKLYYLNSRQHLPGIVYLYTQDNDEQLYEQTAFGQLFYKSVFSKIAFKSMSKISWTENSYHVGIPSGGIKSQSYWQREYYTSASCLYDLSPTISLDYALDYAFDNLNSTLKTPKGYVQGSIATEPYRHSLIQALSVKWATQRLRTIVRLIRSDYFNGARMGTPGIDAHRWSPSVSVSYRILPEQPYYIRGFWKKIFRMPTFNELYYYHLGSTQLAPEDTNMFDIGLTGSFHIGSVTAQMTCDGYLSTVKNKIISIPFNMFVWTTTNLGRVGIVGTDITANTHIPLTMKSSLEYNVNYSYLRAKNRINPVSPYYGNQIAYTPIHSFACALSWSNPWFTFSTTLDGVSDKWTTNEHAKGTLIKGYVEWGCGIHRTITLDTHKVTLRGTINNILNKQYEIVANYPMPGRSWKVGLLFEL